MTFGEIIKEINAGKTVRRGVWWLDMFIVKQIPQTISPDIVPRMTSLPDMAKKHIAQNAQDATEPSGGSISYHDQVIAISVNPLTGDCTATYYIPSWTDIFADDWEVILPS